MRYYPLRHVDYNCDGEVDLRQGLLKCRRCGQTSAFGPITVVGGGAPGTLGVPKNRRNPKARY